MVFKKISTLDDIPTQQEREDLLKDIFSRPIIPISLSSLKPYIKSLKENYSWNIDLSKVKEKDLNKIHSISPEMLLTIVLNDPGTIVNLIGLINAKAIYAKSYEAYVVDKKEMDMSFDEFRARCQLEYETSVSQEEKIEEG